MSMVFPLSNHFFPVIDRPNESYLIPTDIFTPLATVSCFIVVLVIFGYRDYIQHSLSNGALVVSDDLTSNQQVEDGEINVLYSRQALGLFVLGFISIIGYFIANFTAVAWYSQDPWLFIAIFVLEPLALIFYSLFFSLMTSSFTLLGIVEFVKPNV